MGRAQTGAWFKGCAVWAVLAFPLWASAQVHRCVDGGGKVEYRATPCDVGHQSSTLREPVKRVPVSPGLSWVSPNTLPPTVPTQAVAPASGVRIVPLNVLDRAPPRGLVAGAEVVVVSGYQLATGFSQVILNRPGVDVVVVLSSHELARWQVEPTPGTRIRAILVSTDEAFGSVSSVLDTPTYRVKLPVVTKADSVEFRDLLATLNRWFGTEKVDAFRGSYNVPNSAYIGAAEQVAGLSLNGEPAEIPSVVFPFSLLRADMTALRHRNNGPDALAAPSTSPLVGSAAVLDGTGTVAFELSDNRVYRRELPAGRKTPLPLPPGWPEVSWGNALAYDSDLQLVTLFSFGGEGFLYRYDVKSQRWKDYQSLSNVDVGAVTYDASARRYVAWHLMRSDLLFLSPEGRLVSQKPVGSLLRGLGEIERREGFETRMLPIASGGQIAMVYLGDRAVSRIWTYDEAKHQAQLTYKGAASPTSARSRGGSAARSAAGASQ